MTTAADLRAVLDEMREAVTVRELRDGMVASEAITDWANRLESTLAAPEVGAVAVPQMPGNWPEDAASENGDYQCRCVTCGGTFYGHKRRVICKLCSKPTDAASAGLSDFDEAMERMEALLDTERGLITFGDSSATMTGCRADMQTIRATVRRLSAQPGAVDDAERTECVRQMEEMIRLRDTRSPSISQLRRWIAALKAPTP